MLATCAQLVNWGQHGVGRYQPWWPHLNAVVGPWPSPSIHAARAPLVDFDAAGRRASDSASQHRYAQAGWSALVPASSSNVAGRVCAHRESSATGRYRLARRGVSTACGCVLQQVCSAAAPLAAHPTGAAPTVPFWRIRLEVVVGRMRTHRGRVSPVRVGSLDACEHCARRA